MNNNTQALDNKVNEIGMTKVKLLSIELTSEAQTKKSIADIGISEPSAKLI